MECLEGRNGMHIFEDHFIVETINPKTGEVLPEGEEGELVFTTLTKEAGPLIRYRTGDISRLITEPCRCGRSHVKMERVLKRSDDMLIIRGVNIFPSQIEAILVDIEGLQPNYQIIVDKVGALDSLDLQVEVNEKIFSDSGSVKELQKMEKRIIKDMTDYLGITARVKLVEPNTMKVEQISVFLENKPGSLEHATGALKDANINIRTLSLAETVDFGILRLIVNDVEKANKVLKDNGFRVSKTPVVAVEVPDKPGGLHSIMEVVSKEGINVEYIYAFVEKSGQNAVIIFRFDNPEKAIEVLLKHNFKVVPGAQLYDF